MWLFVHSEENFMILHLSPSDSIAKDLFYHSKINPFTADPIKALRFAKLMV